MAPSHHFGGRAISGLLLVIGPIQFVAVTTLEAVLLQANGYSYSFLSNTISNLGDPSLYPFPYFGMLNLSAIALGTLVLAGLYGFASMRPRGPLGTATAVFLGLVGVGAIGVGVFNEHLNYPVHIASATLAFVGGGVTMLLLALSGWNDPRWKGWSAPSLVGAVITGVALVEFGLNTTWLIGHGGWERLVVAAPVIWVIAVGVKVMRTERSAAPAAVPARPRAP